LGENECFPPPPKPDKNLTLLHPSPDSLLVHFFPKPRGRERDTASGFDVRFENKILVKNKIFHIQLWEKQIHVQF